MKRIIEPGHCYELLTLDGDVRQELTFVKRCDLEHPERFPGNFDSHPGTNLQSVIRALLDRVAYLQNQIPCDENIAINNNLRNCLYLLEHRAARRHGFNPDLLTPCEATFGKMCEQCGHVMCNCAMTNKPPIEAIDGGRIG